MMKYFFLIVSAIMMLFIDGTLTYGIFDPKTWTVADMGGLLLALILLCAIAWADHTKNNKHDHTPR